MIIEIYSSKKETVLPLQNSIPTQVRSHEATFGNDN